MRNFRMYVLLVVFLLAASSSYYISTLERERRDMKEDLIELSKIKYGLFNVDEWKKILASIITKKVEELNLQGGDREAMRKKISALLYKVIDDFEGRYYKQKSRSLRGILESTVTSMFGAFDTIRKDVPKFTDQILDFMNDPANRKAVRGYIIDKLNTYADNTFSQMDYTVRDEILGRYDFANRDAAIDKLSERIHVLDSRTLPVKLAVLLLTIVVIVAIFIAKNLSKPELVMLVLISFVLLAEGLVLPMIEIDARISRMSFTLLGENILFADQVLYYKSKSILEVVQLMLTQSRWDVFVVGILVLIFSVLFPVSKLVASVIYVYAEELRANKLMRFLVFKTGKWSMADVMVVAIFMSYIGFSGIITEQLKQIESLASGIDILTTNKSSLLTGFFYFTSFAIFSLGVTSKLDAQTGTTLSHR